MAKRASKRGAYLRRRYEISDGPSSCAFVTSDSLGSELVRFSSRRLDCSHSRSRLRRADDGCWPRRCSSPVRRRSSACTSRRECRTGVEQQRSASGPLSSARQCTRRAARRIATRIPRSANIYSNERTNRSIVAANGSPGGDVLVNDRRNRLNMNVHIDQLRKIEIEFLVLVLE